MARVIAYGEPRDDRDGVAIGVVRSDKGDDIGEGSDEGRAWDSRDGEFRGGVCGRGGVESGGCYKDESDEYEGGGRGDAAVQWGVGLCDEDGESGGADGSLQRIYSYNFKAGTFHCRLVCHT